MGEETKRLYLGIDPGTSGGVIALDQKSKPSGGIAFKNTDHDISLWFKDLYDLSCETNVELVACIENVHAMPKQGVSSSFVFGKSYGFIIGLLTAFEIPFKLVTPQSWQKRMQCLTKGDKNISKAAAQRLWPGYAITHAFADALLIAEYGRLTVWQK